VYIDVKWFCLQYILNVTADLPNVFEDSGSIKYMKIPIADHWKENLASFFPKAIEFIGKFFLYYGNI
jgi:dual specificity MAP kinase phosphatase